MHRLALFGFLLFVPLTTGCTSFLGGPAGDVLRLVSSESGRTGGYRPVSATATSPTLASAGAANDRGRLIDVEAENRQALERIASSAGERDTSSTELIVVPGFATRDQTTSLHSRAKVRLRMAIKAYRKRNALAILVSGGNVWPARTPYNEAMEMKRYLLSEGVPEEQIVVDPYARHSTTNLRNAGRFMLSAGLSRALVVTTPAQAFYFRWPILSSFHVRCLVSLGYFVGRLSASEGDAFTHFEDPNVRVLEQGSDPLDP